MKKWVTIVVVLVVVLVVMAMLCEAQRNSRGNRRNRQRGNNRERGNRNNTRTATRRGNRNNARRAGGGRRRGGNRRRPHSSCEEIYLPMCKGLIPYSHTKLPNRYNHTTQAEVYRVIEHLWAHMDHSCSKNTRMMICAKYLPKCHGRRPGLPPCKRTCMTARRKCINPFRDYLGVNWSEQYQCGALPNRRCVRPVSEKHCQYQYPTCVKNSAMPICANLTFIWGTLPNMFEQCDTQEINTEIEYYDALRATNCHANLNFFLCGVYSPFCIRSEIPFTFPCRELCQEIRTACEPHYRRLYRDLSWPAKLQCHRFPSVDTEGYSCVMPNEGANYQANQ